MVNPAGYTALDLIGFTDKGTYLSSANYVKNDLVHYSGNIWRCLVDDTTGIAPAEGVNWTLFIGEPTNLVERIIAPVETDPATSAWAVGRQIIFNDNLYEVITAITAGDSLVTYEDDPANANIKLADSVETQLLNVKGNLTNRNLLDNAWFTVNQRGQSSYTTGTSYINTFDRWLLYNATLTKNTNGVRYTATSSSLCVLRQFIENVDSLDNKIVTLSAIINNELKVLTGTFLKNNTNLTRSFSLENGSFALQLIMGASDTYARAVLATYTTENLDIKAFKLELGSISTLSQDTAPNYTEELLKCQRYFYRISIPIYQNGGIGLANTGNSVTLTFYTPVNMRVKPSVSKDGTLKLRNGSSIIPTINNIIYGADDSNRFDISFGTENNALTIGTAYQLYATLQASYLDFSADL